MVLETGFLRYSILVEDSATVMRVEVADPGTLEGWDSFIGDSVNGIVFHRRSFLAYHGDRFHDREQYLVFRKGESLVATLSLARDTDDPSIARSPYGASFGGMVFREAPTYSQSRAMVEALLAHLRASGIRQFRITMVPEYMADGDVNTFTFALLEAGFHAVNRDISSVVLLRSDRSAEEIISGRARRNAKKAEKAGVVIRIGASPEDFMVPLDATFEKHGTSPTHSLEELVFLQERHPDLIGFDVAYLDEKPVAGLGLFQLNRTAVMSFYICQTSAGANVQALSLLLREAIGRFKGEGFRCLDMGTSSVNMVARPNIFFFKEGFGARGYFRETLEWNS